VFAAAVSGSLIVRPAAAWSSSPRKAAILIATWLAQGSGHSRTGARNDSACDMDTPWCLISCPLRYASRPIDTARAGDSPARAGTPMCAVPTGLILTRGGPWRARPTEDCSPSGTAGAEMGMTSVPTGEGRGTVIFAPNSEPARSPPRFGDRDHLSAPWKNRTADLLRSSKLCTGSGSLRTYVRVQTSRRCANFLVLAPESPAAPVEETSNPADGRARGPSGRTRVYRIRRRDALS
jgi:hypothetical protein